MHCNSTLASSSLHIFFLEAILISLIMNSLGFQPTLKFFKYQVATGSSRAEPTPTVLGLIIVVSVDKKVELSKKKKKKKKLICI